MTSEMLKLLLLQRAAVLILLALGLLSGCASQVKQQLSPDIFYKRDIEMTVNGQAFSGAGVPKKASEYVIELRSRGAIDMLTVTSCHREESFEKPARGWFQDGKSFVYLYRPVKAELGAACLLDIGAYEEGRGRHSWAMLDFESSETTLPALTRCNGQESVNPRGVSICQAKAGLVQQIHFEEPVKLSPDNDHCDVMQTQNSQDFEFLMPSGECVYYFGTKSGRFHKMTTLGYQSILIRRSE